MNDLNIIGAEKSERVKKLADRFREMADRIERNCMDGFGGAILAIPPGDGASIELLLLDAREDLAQFWGILVTRGQIALTEADGKNRMQTGFGHQRG